MISDDDTLVRDVKLIVGAGPTSQPGWFASNQDELDLLKPESWRHYLGTRKVAAILAEHVWEHLHIADGLSAARLCFEHLKPGGYCRIAVPDGLSPIPGYLDYVKPGGTGAGAEDHKVLFTYRTLSQLFEQAGFTVRLHEYYDDDGQFHFKEWSPSDGMIDRSIRFDERNANGRVGYTSLILDAIKPSHA